MGVALAASRNLALLAALAVAASAGSLLLGQDANWDMQNYHFYIPWAWWHGRTFDVDIAAAQIQTFHNPLLDLPFFAMVTAQWPPRVIAVALALPAAVTGFFLCRLALLLFAPLPVRERTLAIACSALVGLTSAMGIGGLGNTMNEWVLAALVTFAVWLVAREAARVVNGRMSPRVLLAAGVAAGVAVGAKLTAATFAIALCAALVVRRRGIVDAAWFAAGTVLGFAVAYGPWAYTLWSHFGNPVFPYGNQWFRSPWWEPLAIPGRDFGPHDPLGWFTFPFALADPPLYLVAEVPYRDGRLGLVWALALVAAMAWLLRRPRQLELAAGTRAAWGVVVRFAMLSFVVWAALFSIYRYLLPLDVLTGVLAVGALWMLARPRFAASASVASAAMLIAFTSIANWGRVPFGERWFEVKVPMPPVQPDALVLITTGEGVAYFIPMLPPTSRYLGVHNTLVAPGQQSRLAQSVREIVRGHRGPFYQLTFPLTEGREVVAWHGLARTTACAVVVTNMPVSPLELCILVRREPQR